MQTVLGFLLIFWHNRPWTFLLSDQNLTFAFVVQLWIGCTRNNTFCVASILCFTLKSTLYLKLTSTFCLTLTSTFYFTLTSTFCLTLTSTFCLTHTHKYLLSHSDKYLLSHVDKYPLSDADKYLLFHANKCLVSHADKSLLPHVKKCLVSHADSFKASLHDTTWRTSTWRRGCTDTNNDNDDYIKKSDDGLHRENRLHSPGIISADTEDGMVRDLNPITATMSLKKWPIQVRTLKPLIFFMFFFVFFFALAGETVCIKTPSIESRRVIGLKIHRLQARPWIVQPGNCTGWDSEGVNAFSFRIVLTLICLRFQIVTPVP